eukprot:366112-Chlamydomonas_euryale.AAC.31
MQDVLVHMHGDHGHATQHDPHLQRMLCMLACANHGHCIAVVLTVLCRLLCAVLRVVLPACNSEHGARPDQRDDQRSIACDVGTPGKCCMCDCGEWIVSAVSTQGIQIGTSIVHQQRSTFADHGVPRAQDAFCRVRVCRRF